MITLIVRLASWLGLLQPTPVPHVHSYRPWLYPPIGDSGRWRYCRTCSHIDWELIDG